MKIPRVTITIFFIVITMASSLKMASTIGYYALFTKNFVERFCENTARPELNCDGKCVLAKMLLQETNDERTPINLDWLKTETVLFVGSLITMEFSQQQATVYNNLQYSNLYNFPFSKRIAHPPQV